MSQNKTKVFRTLKFIKSNPLKLNNTRSLSICYNKFGKGNSSIRLFEKTYFPSIEYHNSAIELNKFKFLYKGSKPKVSIQLSKLFNFFNI